MVYLFLKHGMRWTTLRGLKRDTIQAMLVPAAMNLKKMAAWLWKTGHPSDNKHKRTPAVQFFRGSWSTLWNRRSPVLHCRQN
ncbi:hypothetical protein FLT43_09580 [Paenibacillus thiaminolyticus]|uniref:Transposase DDE domain-containing protein n=1 Tax=Paenibacillus thiaminolyticus TaxID=49283 RepID=A0AAP9DSW6_PANTH|nr:hypothetical protein FLT43_09580 [Paenibacillus thiaminolyticus]